MTTPIIKYVASGGQREFDVPFPYLSRDHVKVSVNGLPAIVAEWVNSTRLKLLTSPGSQASVVVYRDTPIDEQLVVFQNDAVLTEEDLNLAVKQLLYRNQELTALYNGALKDAQVRLAENLGIVVDPENVADQLSQLVLESSVLATFQTRINDIDANTQAILENAMGITDLDLSVNSPSTGNTVLKTLLDDLRADHETLVGVVDALTMLTSTEGIAALIEAEQNARIDGDTALAATIALIGAKSGDNLSFILDVNKVKVSPTESLATRLSNLTAADAANVAAIQNEETVRAAADAAEAAARTTLAATLTADIDAVESTLNAAVVSEQSARIAADTAEATARTTLGASLTTQINNVNTTLSASIANESLARADADGVFASQFSLLGAAGLDGTSWVLNDANVKLSDGTSVATRLAGLQSSINANTASIASEQTTRANADASLASSISTLNATVNTNNTTVTAAINSEATARANADTAFTNTFNLLGAKNGAGTAFILNDNTVLLQSTGGTLVSKLDSIGASIGSLSASINTEQSARIAQDGVLASNISSLTTTVNGNTASISTIQTSLNGVVLKYGVTLDSNGYVTGFQQNNNGTSGSFDIVADYFRVAVPGSSPRTVFSVTGSEIYLSGNVKISGNLIVNGTITTGALAANSISKMDFNKGTYANVTTTLTERASVTQDSFDGTAKWLVTITGTVQVGSLAGSTAGIYASLYRNGTFIEEVRVAFGQNREATFNLPYVFTGLTGTQTFKLYLRANVGPGSGDPHLVNTPPTVIVQQFAK